MTTACSKPTRSPTQRCTPRPTLRIEVCTRRGRCVAHVIGELDRATRDQLVDVTRAGHGQAMIIDLGGVTFMDCSGYGGLVAARLLIEAEGGSLAITGQTGQPARLCQLIADLEGGDRHPV